MPQLDFSIIFPQIFWLCIFFSFLYYVLSTIFLPKFLLNLKLRKFLISENSKKISQFSLQNSTNLNQQTLVKNIVELNKNFDRLQYILSTEINKPVASIDKKFSLVIIDLVLFCNPILLNTIEFFPKNLNSKFF